MINDTLTEEAARCAICSNEATHLHVDPKRQVDEQQCDHCCDKNCQQCLDDIDSRSDSDWRPRRSRQPKKAKRAKSRTKFLPGQMELF